jgi:hypothetical protein
MWTRTVSVIEERKDDPPENEQDSIYQLERMTSELGARIAGRKKKTK